MNADLIANALRVSDVICRSVLGSRPYIPPTGKSPRPLFSMAIWEGRQRATTLDAKLPISYYCDVVCAMTLCSKEELLAQLEYELESLHKYRVEKSKGFIDAVIAHLKSQVIVPV